MAADVSTVVQSVIAIASIRSLHFNDSGFEMSDCETDHLPPLCLDIRGTCGVTSALSTTQIRGLQSVVSGITGILNGRNNNIHSRQIDHQVTFGNSQMRRGTRYLETNTIEAGFQVLIAAIMKMTVFEVVVRFRGTCCPD